MSVSSAPGASSMSIPPSTRGPSALHAAWIAAHAPDFLGRWHPVLVVRNHRPVLQVVGETATCAS